MSKPFDAVLVVAFGGPQGPADVRPFLGNVLRGRRISPERLEEVVGHYEHFGGVSPLTDITMRQARGLEERLTRRGFDLPVYVGMRNWHPFLADTHPRMAAAGVAATSACVTQRINKTLLQLPAQPGRRRDARADGARDGLPDVPVDLAPASFYNAPQVRRGRRRASCATALERSPGRRARARTWSFTAHSRPGLDGRRMHATSSSSSNLPNSSPRCSRRTVSTARRLPEPQRLAARTLARVRLSAIMSRGTRRRGCETWSWSPLGFVSRSHRGALRPRP